MLNLINSKARFVSLSLSVSVTVLPGDDPLLPSEALNCSTLYSVTESAKANGLTWLLLITIPNVYSDDGICNSLMIIGVVSQRICCMSPGEAVHVLFCGVVFIDLLVPIVNCIVHFEPPLAK